MRPASVFNFIHKMGNLVPTAVCNLYEKSSVHFPYEHPVELRKANGELLSGTVKLDAVHQGNSELLKTFLMQQWGLGGLQERYTLYWTRDPLTSANPLLLHILPCNRIPHLVMSNVGFVLLERA